MSIITITLTDGSKIRQEVDEEMLLNLSEVNNENDKFLIVGRSVISKDNIVAISWTKEKKCHTSCDEDKIDYKSNAEDYTKLDIKDVLKYLNKPFIHILWETSISENKFSSINIFGLYMKNLKLSKYRDWTWNESDL